MRDLRIWLAAFALALAVGLITTKGPLSSTNAAPAAASAGDWRYHDGHWSYWHPGDKTWYYTDGTRWYYHDKKSWHPYRFDRGFGRKHFHRGDYRHQDDVKVE